MHGARNIKVNASYRNAVARARNAALMRLSLSHPEEYRRLLREEREKEGLHYLRVSRLSPEEEAV